MTWKQQVIQYVQDWLIRIADVYDRHETVPYIITESGIPVFFPTEAYNERQKHDQGKARWELLPMKIMEAVVWVLTFGAVKYEENNWQKVEKPVERYYGAAMRHLTAWWNDGNYQEGEQFDFEYQTHHLAHAICCLIFICWFEAQRLGKQFWSFLYAKDDIIQALRGKHE